ncbi:hypothetical protein EV385_3578 [Krasilnikovia cinnamomea]|uniref:Methyltransferase family protein n=1 Tax=Krasilnikovia cinnamomea TaxID=349313 RepID=A0A4Q7ZN05_9ACTN|nr:hypothetical protein [Krasilnikovia cinnamomea]RZU51745.1 hypothetical protein EV385_3578 [Krasilnikovia cinnamomea]
MTPQTVRLIGGEMPAWSDRRPGERPPAGGPVLAHLLGRLAALLPAGGRALIAGPHDDAILAGLAAHTDVTCLLRSQPDADGLTGRGVTVLCGTLAKLTDTDRYDIVVALDGLDRLCSVEGPQYDWAEALQVLRRTLRPGGTLLLTVENELGVHRLVDRTAATSAHTDGVWRPLGEFDESRPGNPARLSTRLAAEGLAVSWLAAVWPLPSAPTLAATPYALQDGPVGALAGAAAGAVGAAYARRPVLSDPRRLAAAAVRGGLGAEFAAAWIVLAHRSPRPAPSLPLPPALLSGGTDGSATVLELSRDRDGGWTRRVVGGTTEPTPHRDPAALDGPMPGGRLLEELLISACLRHDLPRIRRLLSGWSAWLATLDGQRAYATADNVLLDGEAYALLDPSPRDPDPPGAPEAAVAALRRLAHTLITGGYAHPWPAATDPDTLTAVLAGAAGLGPDLPGTPPRTGPAEPDSLREHEEQLRALRAQLADATARTDWYERELALRDAELRRAHLQIAVFSGGLGHRLARLGLTAARRALRRSRT